MNKPIVALTALVIAAGGSVGAYMAVKNKKDTETKQAEEAAASLSIYNFDPYSVEKLEITAEDGSYTIEKSDDDWVLTSGGDFDLEQDYITLICEYASDLTAIDSYAIDADNYGLTPPSSSVTLYSGDSSYTINVGNMSPTGNCYYISTGNDSKAYAVDTINGSALKLDGKMLHTKSIVPYSDYDIVQLTVSKGGEVVYDLNYDDETGWSLPEEYSCFKFDSTRVSSVIATLTRLEVQKILEKDPADLAPYGLEEPYAEIYVKGKDGTERRILAGDTYGDLTERYVLLCEDAQLESCYTADLGFIDYTPFNYILQEFYNPDYSEITGFELSFNGREDSFTCDSEALAGTMNGTAFDLNDQDTLTAFQNFYRSFSNVYLSDIDIEAEPELKDPILTVVYHLKDGGDRTYQLTDAGNGQAYIFADGEFTCQLMDQEALTGKNSLLSFFEKFRDTIGTE